MGETNGGLVKLGPASQPPMRPARLQRAGGTAKPAFIASVTVSLPEKLPLLLPGPRDAMGRAARKWQLRRCI